MSKNKSNIKNRIISRQNDKINSLQKEISNLQIDNAKKIELINSIDILRNELFNTVNELKNKSNKYDKLIAELTQMINVMNKTVFKGRWKFIRLLLK